MIENLKEWLNGIFSYVISNSISFNRLFGKKQEEQVVIQKHLTHKELWCFSKEILEINT